ncbi:hypothetical protein CULT_1520005 [[Clostridium] ultunense Esp]|nr:hypothetical protein CULT_1520005 [[Clostridium] ultunense Esp]
MISRFGKTPGIGGAIRPETVPLTVSPGSVLPPGQTRHFFQKA